MSDDGELLSDYARRGDVNALATLVGRHAAWMLALLRGMLTDLSDADDAFQESWRRVVKTAGGFRGGSVRAYLATVARSVAIDRLRARRRLVSLDARAEESEGSWAEPVDPAPTPRERFESQATAEDVRLAVGDLPEGERQVVLLRIEGELTFREIAAELGIPLGTALTWMRSATMRLRRRLGKES